ncbi:MAG TPA: CHASE3 domain-containing protein [Steroidobacteraceae bacterium]|nr:CHASE3 domain-containing protein [Steroidobacteraceae bacterium]
MLRDIFKVWLPVLLLAGLLTGLYLLFEQRYSRLNEVSVRVLQIQERQKLLSRFMQLIVDAETGQRGFLLTEQAEYLDPLLNAAPRIREVLDQLGRSYQRAGMPLNPVIELGQLARQRFEILGAGLLHYAQWRKTGTAPAMQGSGKNVMDQLRSRVQELETLESEQFVRSLAQWQTDLRTTRWSMAGATLLNVLLLVAVGAFLLRALNRRSREAAQLKRMVDARTQELLSLSNHLQEVTEREKQSLARELHDALGSLLVATKMDVAWLHARLRGLDPELELRWTRIQESLDNGVDFKRRVVESLRPTLLDNMGLYTALRWQFDETCARNNIKCTHHLPSEEPQFTNDAAIALFRVAQESFTNILRHSAATEAEMEVAVQGEHFLLTITDNGRGLSPVDDALPRHGLAGMRHRINALGGQCEIARREAGGTRVRVSIPIANIIRSATADAEITHLTGAHNPPDVGSQAGTSSG